MNIIVKLGICTFLAAIFSSCGNKEISNESQAQVAADKALKNYCQTASSGDCLNLKFFKAGKFNDKWLVEYQSKHYQYAVIVGEIGSAEITREPK